MSHLLSYSQTIAIETVAAQARGLDQKASHLSDQIEELERELLETTEARDEVQRVFLKRLGVELGGAGAPVPMPATLNELQVERDGDLVRVSWAPTAPAEVHEETPQPQPVPELQPEAVKKAKKAARKKPAEE